MTLEYTCAMTKGDSRKTASSDCHDSAVLKLDLPWFTIFTVPRLQQPITCNVLIPSEDRRFCQSNTVTADQFLMEGGALRLYPATSSEASESLWSCTGVVLKAQAVNIGVILGSYTTSYLSLLRYSSVGSSAWPSYQTLLNSWYQTHEFEFFFFKFCTKS